MSWRAAGASLGAGASFLAVAVVEPMGARLAVLAGVIAVAGAIAWRTADELERETTAAWWRRLLRRDPRRAS
jgi:hypothetical protein